MTSIDMSNFATRGILAGARLGKFVFLELVGKTLDEPRSPQAIALDFKGVDIATASFLRESVFSFKSVMRMRESAFYPFVANFNQEVREELDILAKAMSEVVIGCRLTSSYIPRNVEVIGTLEPKLQLVFDFINRNSQVGAVSLRKNFSDDVGERSTVWNNRLAALASRGLIKVVSNGRSKIYKPVIRENEKWV